MFQILDGHIHITESRIARGAFMERLSAAGVSGGIVTSLPPFSFKNSSMVPSGKKYESVERLDNLAAWTEFRKSDGITLYPFYWIDPLEDDASVQVEKACAYRVKGFKVICTHFHPFDPRAVEIFTQISAKGLPVMFHSGILHDENPSAEYNKPASFEKLLFIDGLRFSLAHISWPWCDEHVALLGKSFFLERVRNAGRSGASKSGVPSMFTDITPGTPPIYRQDALYKLFITGNDVSDRVIFGTDSHTDTYNSDSARKRISLDLEMLSELGLESDVTGKVFGKNLVSFVEGV